MKKLLVRLLLKDSWLSWTLVLVGIGTVFWYWGLFIYAGFAASTPNPYIDQMWYGTRALLATLIYTKIMGMYQKSVCQKKLRDAALDVHPHIVGGRLLLMAKTPETKKILLKELPSGLVKNVVPDTAELSMELSDLLYRVMVSRR